MVTVPKVSVSRFSNFVTSKEVLIAGASFVLTPIALSKINGKLGSIPFVGNNPTLALVLVAFVIFLIGSQMSGFVRTIIIAVGAGVFVSAVLAIPSVQSTLSRVGAN